MDAREAALHELESAAKEWFRRNHAVRFRTTRTGPLRLASLLPVVDCRFTLSVFTLRLVLTTSIFISLSGFSFRFFLLFHLERSLAILFGNVAFFFPLLVYQCDIVWFQEAPAEEKKETSSILGGLFGTSAAAPKPSQKVWTRTLLPVNC